MAAKTHFNEADFVEMLAAYDLATYQSAHPLTDGAVQTNYLIQTTRQSLVLKYYDVRPAQSVRFETNLLHFLGKRRFPCALPYRNKHGEAVSLYHQKPYVLFEYVEGGKIEGPNSQQQHQIIQTAATLQNITRYYRPRLKRYRWNYTPDLCLQLAQREAEKLGTDNARAKLKWFEQILSQLELPASHPKGICHCDYDFSNILFQNDELVALLDFDDANYTYLTFDLVNIIDYWAWPHEGNLDLQMAHEIVRVYMNSRELSTTEKQHLFDVHKLQILFDGIWFFGRGQANDFYERQKIAHLDDLGREGYYQAMFG